MNSRSFKSIVVAITFALIAPLAIFTSSAAQADQTPLIAPAPESSSAAANQTYVYWSFFTANAKSDWKYSSEGAGSVKPAEGTFIGYRWGVGEGEAPRATTDFDKVCAKTTAGQGQHLVALAIDPGTPGAGTPSDVTEQCVSVNDNANALQILQGAAQVRLGSDNAMVCGINGFPATGCSYPANANPAAAISSTESAAATVTQGDSGTGSIVPILIIVGIVLVLLAFIVTLLKSRKKSTDTPS